MRKLIRGKGGPNDKVVIESQGVAGRKFPSGARSMGGQEGSKMVRNVAKQNGKRAQGEGTSGGLSGGWCQRQKGVSKGGEGVMISGEFCRAQKVIEMTFYK